MKNNLIKIMVLMSSHAFSQKNGVENQEVFKPTFSSYFGIVHPIVTLKKNRAIFNFKKSYTVGFPTGIVLRKNNKYAYSFEIIPFVKYENESSKLVNVLFHPGVTFYLKNKMNLTPRLAFETSGRYGFSVIASKTTFQVYKKPVNVHLGTLFRFGSMQNPSQSIALGFSIGL